VPEDQKQEPSLESTREPATESAVEPEPAPKSETKDEAKNETKRETKNAKARGTKKDKKPDKKTDKKNDKKQATGKKEASSARDVRKRLKRKRYEKELARLQVELVKLQSTIRTHRLRVVVMFEGRDAAGKGGVLKRITERLNPRIARIVALGVPTEREKTQWYFQRYVAHLPAAGEMVLLDRSWYNRAGVERVMGFASDDEHQEFLRSCPEFERMLIRSGLTVIKYWFSVSEAEQERRFQDRMNSSVKRWKLSPMDLESRLKWDEYSRAKDEMFAHTDIKQAPWHVVDADDKRRARLNRIRHLLEQIPYHDHTPKRAALAPRPKPQGDIRPPEGDQTMVKDWYK